MIQKRKLFKKAGRGFVRRARFFAAQGLKNKRALALLSLLSKKKALSAVLALISALGLFWFMSVLIFKKNLIRANGGQNLSVEFLSHLREEELQLRSRRRPKKPKAEKALPESPRIKMSEPQLQKPQLETALSAPALPDEAPLGAESVAKGGGDTEAVPSFRIRPVYPRRAALQNIEGFVLLQFDINKMGQTENISVLRARPPQIFNSSAVRALSKWKYKPKIENGRPVRQNGLKVKLDFNLEGG